MSKRSKVSMYILVAIVMLMLITVITLQSFEVAPQVVTEGIQL